MSRPGFTSISLHETTRELLQRLQNAIYEERREVAALDFRYFSYSRVSADEAIGELAKRELEAIAHRKAEREKALERNVYGRGSTSIASTSADSEGEGR